MDSDTELIRRALSGNSASFAELLSRYERLAYATALRIVGDHHAVEDVLQESFVAAFRSLSNLREPSKFGSWLIGITRRQAVRSLQRRREVVALPADTLPEEATGLLPGTSLEVLEIVDHLPDDERALIGLRHFEGFSMHEIADITGRPLGTVTKQLSRIHRKLRDILSEEV